MIVPSKYTRCICFTTDEELLKKIEVLGKELNIQYKIASKDIKDYREISSDFKRCRKYYHKFL